MDQQFPFAIGKQFYEGIINSVGEIPFDPDLEATPQRAVKAIAQMLSGYKEDPKSILTAFPSPYKNLPQGESRRIVSVSNVEYTSMCAHHVLPFIGTAFFAYIPDDRIVGLSKIPRLIDILSRRLQTQEKLGYEIASTFSESIPNHGVAVILTGAHTCLACRGARKIRASMKTTYFTGFFETDKQLALSVLKGDLK